MCQQTVSRYLQDWLEFRTPSLAPSTLDGYFRSLKNHISPQIGSVMLEELTPSDVLRCLAPLCADGKTRQAQLVRVLLRCALQDAVRMGLISHNPADAVRQPAHRKECIKYWTPETIHKFVSAQRFSPLYHVWLLALLCGLRRGELLGLRWSDVDLSAAQIHVCNQRMLINGTLIDRPPKSAAGVRDIPLPAVLVTALTRARRSAASVYVCPLTPQQLRRELGKACAAAGVPTLHIHGLRHSMATAALEAGVDIKVLQTLLGHSHFSVTADTYLHPSSSIRAGAVAALAASVI